MTMNLKNRIRERAKKSYVARKLFNWYCTKCFKRNPQELASKDYKRVMGRDLDWENPQNLIEKIYWLIFNTDTTLWSVCADKYHVRDFVKERGCGNTLNRLYGYWERVEHIDYDSLPDSFVIKTTNSSGQIIIVKDKTRMDIGEVNRKLNQWMNFVYGLTSAQLHYMKIKPAIIAEELLENKAEPAKMLVDYKIWCFNGVPESVLVVFDRNGEDYKLSVFDLEWNNISDRTLRTDSPHYGGLDIPKPTSFDEMIAAAKKLSSGFPEVRVDFYDINGQAVFGELTFSTGYGYFTDDYYSYLGSKVDIQSVKRIATKDIISSIKIGK